MSFFEKRRSAYSESQGLIIILGSIKQPKGKKGDYKIEILAAKSVFFFFSFLIQEPGILIFFSFSAGSKKWADKAGKSKARKALGLFHNPKMKSDCYFFHKIRYWFLSTPLNQVWVKNFRSYFFMLSRVIRTDLCVKITWKRNSENSSYQHTIM